MQDWQVQYVDSSPDARLVRVVAAAVLLAKVGETAALVVTDVLVEAGARVLAEVVAGVVVGVWDAADTTETARATDGEMIKFNLKRTMQERHLRWYYASRMLLQVCIVKSTPLMGIWLMQQSYIWGISSLKTGRP